MSGSAEALTSHPCGWSYDDIDMCLVRVFVPPLGFDGPVDRGGYCVSSVRVFRRPVSPGENPKRGFWCCCHCHFLISRPIVTRECWFWMPSPVKVLVMNGATVATV